MHRLAAAAHVHVGGVLVPGEADDLAAQYPRRSPGELGPVNWIEEKFRLYGFRADVWQAYALAVYVADQERA